jgi:hypothetical protein
VGVDTAHVHPLAPPFRLHHERRAAGPSFHSVVPPMNSTSNASHGTRGARGRPGRPVRRGSRERECGQERQRPGEGGDRVTDDIGRGGEQAPVGVRGRGRSHASQACVAGVALAEAAVVGRPLHPGDVLVALAGVQIMPMSPAAWRHAPRTMRRSRGTARRRSPLLQRLSHRVVTRTPVDAGQGGEVFLDVGGEVLVRDDDPVRTRPARRGGRGVQE